jgi:hypothetical protein
VSNKVQKYGSKKNRLSQKVILSLFNKGLIEIPFRHEDKEFLKKLEVAMMDKLVIKTVLRHFSKRAREILITTVDMPRAEAYIFSRYRNNTGSYLDIRLLVSELEQYFHIKDSIKAKNLIYKVRRKFYNWKLRNKNTSSRSREVVTDKPPSSHLRHSYHTGCHRSATSDYFGSHAW